MQREKEVARMMLCNKPPRAQWLKQPSLFTDAWVVGAGVFLTAGLWASSVALYCPLCFSPCWDEWVIQGLFFLFLKVKVVETPEKGKQHYLLWPRLRIGTLSSLPTYCWQKKGHMAKPKAQEVCSTQNKATARCEEERRANIKSATSSLCPVRAPPGRQRENKASGIITAQHGFAPVTGVLWDQESSLS